MARHFLYMLSCADGTIYTGYTTDPERRLKQHSSGKGSKYTRSRLPVRLSYLEPASSKNKALARELRIKRLGRRDKLRLCEEYKRLHG